MSKTTELGDEGVEREWPNCFTLAVRIQEDLGREVQGKKTPYFSCWNWTYKTYFPGCFSQGVAGEPWSKEGRELTFMGCLRAKEITLIISSVRIIPLS